jgi:hypothetical protein
MSSRMVVSRVCVIGCAVFCSVVVVVAGCRVDDGKTLVSSDSGEDDGESFDGGDGSVRDDGVGSASDSGADADALDGAALSCTTVDNCANCLCPPVFGHRVNVDSGCYNPQSDLVLCRSFPDGDSTRCAYEAAYGCVQRSLPDGAVEIFQVPDMPNSLGDDPAVSTCNGQVNVLGLPPCDGGDGG